MKKYEYLASQLKDAFNNKEIETKLPTEKELATKYNLSINTVRSALELLKNQGIIISRQGSGYYFIIDEDVNAHAIGIKSLGQQFPNKSIESKVLLFEIKKCNEQEAANLGINVNDIIYNIKRVRYVEGVPTIIENTILPYSLLPEFTKEVLYSSIFAYLEEYTGTKVDYSIKEISAGTISEEDSEIVNIPTSTPVLIVKNKGFLKTGVQFEFSTNYHLGEFFRIVVN